MLRVMSTRSLMLALPVAGRRASALDRPSRRSIRGGIGRRFAGLPSARLLARPPEPPRGNPPDPALLLEEYPRPRLCGAGRIRHRRALSAPRRLPRRRDETP